MSEKKKQKHTHYGHRQRKKEEFLARGIEGKPDHEILEILLFYAIPYGDTNSIAHLLVDNFKSLIGVLSAPYEELIKIPGIGEHAASMICFFRLLSRFYLTEKYKGTMLLNNSELMFEYSKALFINAAAEEIHSIFFDDQLNLIGEEKLCDGTFGSVNISMRVVAESALRAKSNMLAIAHNHPNGSSMPSKNDLNSTVEIWKTLRALDIDLIDHIIIGRDGEWSMRYNHTLPQIWRD
ncbi:MAG: hypothetical protein LBR74_06570 [Eubacterium sp.]|jgi:DNA repair protein RadC|nr:hypothetical protein [Eubacterium sp.]